MSGEVNVIPRLRKFRGGAVEAFLGGASLEGGASYKKHPVSKLMSLESESQLLNSNVCCH